MIQTVNTRSGDTGRALEKGRTMNRVNIDWLTRLNNKQKAWLAAGIIVVVGLAGQNNEPRGTRFAPAGGYAAAARGGYGSGYAPAGGYAPQTGSGYPRSGWTPQTGDDAPQAGGYLPQTGGYAPAAPGTGSDTTVPTNGDSVSDQVNNNFSDYMRGQQRVVSENDGQTYITDANADPNQMTDTRDSVSSFSAATPGSEAAGTATVEPSGATTVDTSTSTPVDTSSAATTDTSSASSTTASE
jgi:hypothetical protein